MEELTQNLEQIIKRAQSCESKWENEVKDIQMKLQSILLGARAPVSEMVAATVAASPQQTKKRAKRLSSVDEDEKMDARPPSVNSVVSEAAPVVVKKTIQEKEIVPEPQPEEEPEHIFVRPQRAAKLKADNLKEPSINSKMRRPDNPNESNRKIKKENEERQSQASSKKSNKSTKSVNETLEAASNESVASQKKADESILVVPEKDAPVVEILSEEEVSSSNSSEVAKKKSKKDQASTKNPLVKVKKEKVSLSASNSTELSPPLAFPEEAPVPLKHETTSTVEDTLQTTSATDTTTARPNKRGRKKAKEFNHRPIKEERQSLEPVVPSPVSARTRSGGSISKPRPLSVYEDAVDNMPQEGIEEEVIPKTPLQTPPAPTTPAAVTSAAANICNETVATNNATMVTACGDATFLTNQQNSTFAVPPPQTTFIMENNANATVTISNSGGAKKPIGSFGDATFDVREPPVNDSIMTEDDSFEKPLLKPAPPQLPAPTSIKALKCKPKPNELFNPCVQSPVKKKVEAFENHAQSQKTRSKKTKENSEPELPAIRDIRGTTVTTPVIGKGIGPALGRFLTPTQQTNVTPSSGNAKKLPNSASKIMSFPTSKHSSASTLKSSTSTSSQSLSRENSEDDLKKGFNKLQQLADERKKKRELKHQQAAALREAKEKERAERLKKLMSEREEKNRKKALEMEQKKRELEEINRNLKLLEEREQKQAASSKTKVDAAEAARQERELLEQMKAPRMKVPLPPKQHNKYNFNMLHSDDSTDEEGKSSYKRPNPPQWSKSSVRADAITNQAYLSSDIIDSFFSVQPMTPDLKAIFPNIDARYLKRNSSAIWQTPPRYSEMPKY